MAVQILLGSLILGLCSSINLFLMVLYTNALRQFSSNSKFSATLLRHILLISTTFAIIILAHTIQVWIWAFSLIALGALNDYSDAVYFSLVTYTTVGYGDVTLSSDFRIFGAMASVTGLLGFGISTAFLVEIITKIFATQNE